MSNDITLTGAQRSALLTLGNVADLSDRTQTRLTTGKKVNSVVDDAVAFFQAKGLNDRAADFEERRSGIDQGISSISTAIEGLNSIDSLLKQLKGVAEAAKTQTEAERTASTTQFLEIGDQISQLVEDASYQGLNLLSTTASTLDISFSVRTASRLEVSGYDLNATAANARGLFTGAAAFGANVSFVDSNVLSATIAGGFSLIGDDNSLITGVDSTIGVIDDAISQVRAVSSSLGTNVAILNTRLEFTETYVNTLEGGADKLTLADLNEEGANLVALQTRQQLGIQSLSIAGQQQQAILALLN